MSHGRQAAGGVAAAGLGRDLDDQLPDLEGFGFELIDVESFRHGPDLPRRANAAVKRRMLLPWGATSNYGGTEARLL